MAPKRNQAKSQRGSFLTRGREQLRQRQQTRQQASRQLPPQGGTSAGSPKARGQRVATAVSQRVTQDVATLRALADNMRRNQARADRQIPADKSPSVRRVGPGGANPKPQGQLPPGQRGGDMRQKGGPLAQRQSSAMTERSGGSNARTNSQQRSNQRSGPRPGGYTVVDESPKLPPGKNRGPVRPSIGNVSGPASNPKRPSVSKQTTPRSLQKADGPIGPKQPQASKSQTLKNRLQNIGDYIAGNTPKQQATPASRLAEWLGGDLPKGTARQATASKSSSARGNIATAVTGALGEAAVRPLARAAGQKLGEALRPVGRAIDDRMKGTNSKDEAQRKQRATPKPQMTPAQNARAVRLGQASPADVGRRTTQTPTSGGTQSQMTLQRNASQRAGSPAQRASMSSQSDTLRIGNAPQAPTERRVSASTANRESGNYGTSGTNNKLIDTWMRDRMRQRESAASEAAMTDGEKKVLAEINKKKKEQKK